MKILISQKDLNDSALQEIGLFQALGYRPYVISENVADKGIPVRTFRWPFSGHFRRKFYQMQVDWWIKKHSPQLVIGHGDILQQDVLYLHHCVHLAHELIEGKPLPKNHEVGRMHEQILLEGAFSVLVCNSLMMKRDLIQRFKLDPDKVAVIYPEVNLKKFRVDDSGKVKNTNREKFNIPHEAFVIGLVTAGDFKKNNLHLLIQAFLRVKQINSDAHLFVVGDIAQEYRDMISENVTFAPAIRDVKSYYYLLDVLVLPAHIEEFGSSVLEAMYCGKPVITTRTVGASEILEGKSKDLIMQSMTKDELVDKITSLMNKDYYLEIMKINILTAQKYSSEFQTGKLNEILSEHQILKTV
jgi:UDP-glucose:(heptosyl)LPS alpha-1,3-glucosyltransferase